MELKKNDELTAKVNSISSEGKGITRTEGGFVIFSSNTVPGDIVKLKIRKIKKNYGEADLIEILKKSDNRAEPRCRHFGICGGCKMQNIDYSLQLRIKTEIVKSAFEKIGGFGNITVEPAIASANSYFYRNKMEFSFSEDKWLDKKTEENKKNFALGLHIPKFHSKILDIIECYLQSELSSRIVNFTRDFFRSGNISIYSIKTHSGFLRFLIIRQSYYTEDIMVNLITGYHEKEIIKEYAALLRNQFPEVTTFINSVSKKKAQVASGDETYTIYGKGCIEENIKTENKNFSFEISPFSFFQTNTKQAEKIYSTAVNFAELTKIDTVFDLYSGTGSISVFISDYVNKVIGAEAIEESVEDARKNAIRNNITNCEFIKTDIRDFLKRTNFKETDFLEFGGKRFEKDRIKIILDPPRSGLHPEICRILSETNFSKIIYISCNPSTQARDIKIICENGNYKIDKMQPVDMFPQTYHIENVVSLKRAL